VLYYSDCKQTLQRTARTEQQATTQDSNYAGLQTTVEHKEPTFPNITHMD